MSEAVELLQALLRIDTSNPPGDEKAAIDLVASFCETIGFETETVGLDPTRPNLVATWRSEAPQKKRPLILSCHLDVVPADASRWTHPPFSGHNDGTCIWGRGAIDMKGFAAMALSTLKRLRKEEVEIDRDVIFVAVVDEETGTHLGSKWLVENRPDLLGGNPEYVINEVGGFTVHRNGNQFYPVQVAEKGVAWLRLTATGTPGHSSLPSRDNPVARMAEAILAIDKTTLPWHPSSEAERFVTGFAKPEGKIAVIVSKWLLHPFWGPRLLPILVKDRSRRASLEAILRNTANPTRLERASSINVIPATASVDVDGRLAPGQTAQDLINELRAVVGPEIEIEVLEASKAVFSSTDTELYRTIEKSLRAAAPQAHVVPSIIPGFTDSKNYAKLGAECYGFYPLLLPPDLDFAAMFHGDDERIPIEGFEKGIEILTGMLREFLS